MVKWIDVFETGDAELDLLHRKLVEDCNALLALLGGEGAWPLIVTAARRLVADCIEHFQVEGTLLERIDFPRRAAHAAEHRRLGQELRDLVVRMERADGSLPEHLDLPASLGPTLIDFMVRHDLDYRSHLLYRQGR
jgi:hemerythrin-like metal-binding protein